MECKFRKNETVLLGDKSKLFTVNIDPNQVAQSFIAGLFIVESDIISNQDIVNKLAILFAVIALTLSIVALAIVIAGTLGAAVTITAFAVFFFSSFGIGLISQFIPLLGDDISFTVIDTLAIADKVDVGENFPRTITIGKGFDSINSFDGEYTASARWVGEA